MSLIETITNDVKAAMKSGEKERLLTLRFVLSGLNAAQKEKQMKDSASSLSDDEAISVLQKEAKRRRESIELFRQGGRLDLVTKEEADLAFIDAYLPRALSREEIAALVDSARAAGAKDFSALMKEVMKEVKGRADGKLVGEVIKERIGA